MKFVSQALHFRLLCFFSLVLLSCQPSTGSVAEEEFSDVLVPMESNGKWGYANIEGDVVIEPQYLSVDPFIDSLAAVATADKAFLISPSNEPKSASYSSLMSSFGGYIAQNEDKTYSVLLFNGDIVLPLADTAFFLNESLVEYKRSDTLGLMSVSGDVLIEGVYDRVMHLGHNVAAGSIQGKWFGVHNNTLLNEQAWDFVGPYQQGFAGFNRAGKVGLIDSNARIIANATYDEVRFFNGGVAVVGSNGKCGAIDANGNLVIPMRYDDLGNNSFDVLPYRNNGRFGYVRTDGEELFDQTYAAGSPFYGYNAIVWNDDKMAAIVDASGTPLCDFEYDNILMMDMGIFRVQKGLQFWLMDSLGTLLTQEPMSKITPFNLGVSMCERNEQWNVLRREGTLVFDRWYENVKPMEDGYYLVEDNSKWGVLNPDHEQTVPHAYASIGAFRGGYTWCRNDNKFGILHRDRGEIVAPTYDELGSFNDGVTYFMSNDKMGVIDTVGTVLVPAQYDYAGRLKGTNLFSVSQGRKRGVLSEKGSVLIPVQMDRVEVLESGILKCTVGTRTIYYSQKGVAFTDKPLSTD